MSTREQVQADFDEIATLADPGESGTDRFDRFLLSLVPQDAHRVLDDGCGLGRLTWEIAGPGRHVTGVDLSPAMIERARAAGTSASIVFLQGDFLAMDLSAGSFDCIVFAAAVHHMPQEHAIDYMIDLLSPGGRLILHDLRRTTTVLDGLFAWSACAWAIAARAVRTGRPLPTRRVRQAWNRHAASESYLSFEEARVMADAHLPGAEVLKHWLWRYTIVWDKSGTV